jgi:hypothetical protein
MSVLQKFLSFVLACASSATVARAQSQTTPSLEVKKPAVMVGKFTIRLRFCCRFRCDVDGNNGAFPHGTNPSMLHELMSPRLAPTSG